MPQDYLRLSVGALISVTIAVDDFCQKSLFKLNLASYLNCYMFIGSVYD